MMECLGQKLRILQPLSPQANTSDKFCEFLFLYLFLRSLVILYHIGKSTFVEVLLNSFFWYLIPGLFDPPYCL